ncbi:MAG: tetratricopeptide repeat protein [Bacteroidota bacterium]|jgi:tetratricopeptide (TPR) repeat protein|nr:tetratricopeptide repeat protein [Bacteroidota bacterium]
MREILLKSNKTVLLFFCLTFLFYGNTLKNKYSLDDDYVTVTNFKNGNENYVPNHKLVKKGFKGIPRIWKERYAHDTESSFDYRPLVTTIFAIEYGIFGQSPFISHLLNILFYFLICCVLFFTIQTLFEKHIFKDTISFLTAFIFLIHPAHTEVVNNIKCRDELMALLFSLLAVLNSLRYYDRASVKYLFAAFVFLILGLFCKRTAILTIAVIPLCFIFYRTVNLKKTIWLIGTIMVALIVIAVTKKTLVAESSVRYFYHFENPVFTEHFGFLSRIFVAIKSLGFYVKFLLFPFPFKFYYGANTIDLYTLDLNSIIGILFLVAGTWYIIKSQNKHFFFGFLFFSGCIFPFTNLLTPMPGIVGERLCFYASVGFCVMLASLLLDLFPNFRFTKLQQFSSKPLSYVLPLAIVCLVYVFNRNKNWYDKLTLFEHDAPYIENSSKANSLLANEYFEMLRSSEKKYPPQTLINKALKHYQLAILNDSSIYTAYNNAGVLYYSYLGDLNNAKRYFELAIQHKEKYAQANENLGNVYKSRQNYDTAISYYLKAIRFNSKQYNSGFEIINSLNAQKKYHQAILVSDIFLDTDLDDYSFLILKANALMLDNQHEKALAVYELAYQLRPSNELKTYMNSRRKK